MRNQTLHRLAQKFGAKPEVEAHLQRLIGSSRTIFSLPRIDAHQANLLLPRLHARLVEAATSNSGSKVPAGVSFLVADPSRASEIDDHELSVFSGMPGGLVQTRTWYDVAKSGLTDPDAAALVVYGSFPSEIIEDLFVWWAPEIAPAIAPRTVAGPTRLINIVAFYADADDAHHEPNP